MTCHGLSERNLGSVVVLSVQINGEWVQADDQSLVAWMLDGKVEELTPTRDPVKSGTVCPLIESLQPFQ
ncbi:MAG: hypothetical protein ACM3VT_12565, partial [Solirubrobacterales bacterium]